MQAGSLFGVLKKVSHLSEDVFLEKGTCTGLQQVRAAPWASPPSQLWVGLSLAVS